MNLEKISYEEFMNLLVSKATKERVEIEWTTNPEGSSIVIRPWVPWVPFTYTCPYGNRPADIGDLLQKGKLNEP